MSSGMVDAEEADIFSHLSMSVHILLYSDT